MGFSHFGLAIFIFYFFILILIMGDTQKTFNNNPIIAPTLPGTTMRQESHSVPTPPPITPPAPDSAVTPPPIAPVHGPVSEENSMNVPVNINLDPKTKREVIPNGLMPDALATKKKLDAQPKVSMWLPCTGGEKAGKALEYVSINGYPYWVPKGTMVMVPKSVAELLMNLYNIEIGDSAFGRGMRVDSGKFMEGVAIQDALAG